MPPPRRWRRRPQAWFARLRWLPRRGVWAAVVGALLLGRDVLPDRLAAEPLPGPIPAELVRIVDGDTIEVRAEIWIGQTVVTFVRLAGIDAPEVRGTCTAEKKLGQAATARLGELLRPGARLLLHEVEHGKFAGRVLARVTTLDGRDVATALLVAGLAQRYDGRRRDAWC